MHKKILLAALLIVCSTSLFAGGKKDLDEKEVSQKESWQESFPIDEKKPGKYNIVVTAEDEGGNVSTVGPYNIMIDPNSDLPITGITNPPPQMRVPGNLNIVGTCVDDDAVDHVLLILDGDEENPIRAEGKEFWSYYLDTTKLAEGKHTISVYGVDINGTPGHRTSADWHLDRYAPTTTIENYELGQLVSGKIELHGVVEDGNGIKSLAYSLSSDDSYESVKLNYDKKNQKWSFKLSIDTKKLEDGPHVCWFKGIDQQGTEGTSSFLFFVDNTAPDLHLFSPKEDEKVNGIFSVAGSAYDTIGVSSITWQLGKETGEFELIPGNPYWIKEFDIRGQTAKTQDLTIRAVDKSGNVSTLKRKLAVDLVADLPVVTLDRPFYDPADKTDKTGPLVDNDFYIRGSVQDDDGAALVYWTVDNGEEHVIETEGVFYQDVLPALGSELKQGLHVLRIWAEDVHGTKGNAVTVPFTIKGIEPTFLEATVLGTPYINGMEVHPETKPSLSGKVKSDCGINKISWVINGNNLLSGETVLKSVKGESKFNIPLTNTPWGLLEIIVKAEDVYGRTTETSYYIYETNLSKVRSEPKIVFNQTELGEGTSYGYFVGGKAVDVAFEPETEYANVRLNNNSIVVKTTGKTGQSEPVKVKVTTDKGLVYESEKISFFVPEAKPTLKLNNSSVFDGFNKVNVTGSVASLALENKLEVGYRILTAANSVANAKNVDFEMPLFQKVSVNEDGTFQQDFDASLFEEGITIIEFYAKTGYSEESYNSVAIKKISPLPQPDPNDKKAKAPKAATPAFNWIEGKQLYYTCYYQDELTFSTVDLNKIPLENVADPCYTNQFAGALPYSLFAAGTSNIDVKVLDVNQKAVATKYTVKQFSDVTVRIDSVKNESGEVATYLDGMNVTLPFIGSKVQNSTMRVVAKADLPVTTITYAFNDGSATKATPKKVLDASGVFTGEYEIYIPLKNLEAEITDVTVYAEVDKDHTSSYKGTICVLREVPEHGLNDKEQVFWQNSKNYNKTNQRILTIGETVDGYVNVMRPFKAVVSSEHENLSVSVDEAIVSVKPTKEGYYQDVVLTITDSQGIEYTTSPISFWVDNKAPEITVLSPTEQKWLQNEVNIELKATDFNGLNSVEYRINESTSWTPIVQSIENAEGAETAEIQNATSDLYSINVPLNKEEEGLVSIDVRATDSTGRTTIKRLSSFKDITPPTVEIVIPAPGDVVNGETQLALKVLDNGKTVSGTYILPAIDAVSTAQAPETEESADTPKAEDAPQIASRAEIKKSLELMSLVPLIVGREDAPIDESMIFSFTDASGNTNDYSTKEFTIDSESDKPKTEIHLPEDNAIITTDFIISGIVYDDDGDCSIFYKLDDGDYTRLSEMGTSFSIPIELESLTDNEHTYTIYAEDMFGIVGDPVSVNIRVSLEEPKGAVQSPTFEETVTGRVVLSGVTSDKNGIDRVQISVDNGNSWNDVAGTEEWSYEFDTRVLQDGTHVVFLKVWDEYQVQALYSSLINIDNTAPEIQLDLPLDDSTHSTGKLFLSGQTTDNIGLEKLYLRIRNMVASQAEISDDLSYINLSVDEIISNQLDISNLPDGEYNIELTGEDAAGNVTRVSRNIFVDTKKDIATLDLLYPLNGEHVQGVFNIYGHVETQFPINTVLLFIDGKQTAATEITSTGYYKFSLSPELLNEGDHIYSVRTILDNGQIIYSTEQYFSYSPTGPWISITNFAMGDFAIDRPYLEGEAGYAISEAEMLALSDKATTKYERDAIKAKALQSVEISFDNGKTFTEISEKNKWRYRIENQELAEGNHYMVIRAVMLNGEQAITRMMVQVDKTPPSIKLITPEEGGHYNEFLNFSGLTSDDVALKSVSLALRSGDKASYEVPSFIQGLYLDSQFWGASFFNIGAGLTFFDDNVKLQFQYGQFTEAQYAMFTSEPMRYGGDILGIKLLANIGFLPFSFFFGPDWNWLSASFALGANFSVFSKTQSGSPQILSALLVQIEFPKITLEKMNMFSTYSFYTEGQLWSIPTDVAAGEAEIAKLIPQISFGIRVNVF